MSFFAELKRRNVFKVATAYIIVGWLVMQAGETLAPALRLPEWTNSLLAFLLILGFPLAMFFAWAYEMTPEGLKKEKDVNRSQSITQVTGQKLNNVIIGILVLALGYFTIDKFVLDPQRDAELVNATQTATENAISESADTGSDADRSIAVLPFINMSSDPEQEYFSDGITEEVLNLLAKIPDLKVTSRSSVFSFKGQNTDIPTVAEKLGVAHVLEGSVRKSGNRVRITAQLIEAEKDVHMWSETYDRELNDIFAIQDEIAHKVAQALRITLLGEDEARLDQVASTEINAYDLYLKGLQGINESGYVSLDRSATLFQEALTLDPSYTPAKIGLVTAWTAMATTGAISYQQALDRGLPLLEQILEEQPQNSAARFQMANLKVFQGDNAAAEKAFIAALDDDPRNAHGLKQYGRFLFNNGRVDQGMELINAAVEIDPYSVRVLWEQCQTNAYLQRVEIALAACERVKEIEPESPSGWYGWGLTHSLNGDMARASYGFTEAIKRDPGDFEMIAAMAFYWVTMGDADQAEQWLQRAEAIGAGQPFPIVARLRLLKFREQHDRARDLAGRTLAQDIESRHGSDKILKHTWAYESARAGNFQAALEPFQESLPWAFEPELVLPDNFAFQAREAIQIAALLKMADPTSERPEQLLKAVENLPDQRHPAWGVWSSDIDKAAIATVRGDYEIALEWLNVAWEKNWRFMWRETLVEDAVFSLLNNEPGYRDLVSRFEADMEQQRELAYELLGVER